MNHFQFEGILQNDGWVTPAYVSTSDNGNITYLSDQPQDSVSYNQVKGYALPGFQNAHSHAFQYAMAGIAEVHKVGEITDDFWSWREAMYKVALTIDPDQLEAIATMLYTEMAKHGYTQVAEFHYLHHDKNGNPYQNLAEMGERLVSAAQTAGIKITLVPMFYQMGGFGMEAQDHQRRFISPTIDHYDALLDATKTLTERYDHANHGFGIHSLRAVKPENIITSLAAVQGDLPIHIHISEQLKEIEDAVSYLGNRPVQWLLNNTLVNQNFHLVHATHLDANEVTGIAKSGAHVVICPSTEGNLGDGIFPLKSFQDQGGKWSIGTDSHVGLNPLEELRLLDYGQRLSTHHRNTFTSTIEGNSGTYAIRQSLIAGRAAMCNTNTSYFKLGEPLDAVVYGSQTPLIAASSEENLLATLIYSSDSSHTLGTLVDGRWIVLNNHHHQREAIVENFGKAIREIGVR